MRKRTDMKYRTKRGTSLIESITVAIVLVPIALVILDLIVLVIANNMNDTAAKNAARAGANQGTGSDAVAAAKNSLSKLGNSSIVQSIEIQNLVYQKNDSVLCQTKMVVRLPVPFPGMSNLTFTAQDVEPILVKEP